MNNEAAVHDEMIPDPTGEIIHQVDSDDARSLVDSYIQIKK